jgi:hypothetical protein
MQDDSLHGRRRLAETIERVTRLHFGGAPKPMKAPPPIPPVTTTNSEVQQADRQTRMDAQKRKGAASTILGGELTGQPASQYGGKTLLG